MTDLGESKAVPERWREVYDNYKPKQGVFESVERVQGRYWCHRAVEELGTAEAKVRELEEYALKCDTLRWQVEGERDALQAKVSQQPQAIAELHQMIEELGAQHSIEWHAENKKVCEQAQTIERLTKICCGALCLQCAKGSPVIINSAGYYSHQEEGNHCNASRIHAALEPEP